MIQDVHLITLFSLGFFGGTHCVGMCGGISSAFILQLPAHMNRKIMIIIMNVGRLCSYTFIGAIMGAVAQAGLLLDKTHYAQTILYLCANLLLLTTGLYLAGLFHFAARIEQLGKPIWRHLNPILNRLLPIRSYSGAFAAGVLWGWLPCGLVYNATLYALGSGSTWKGALYLLAFGLGTLPNLFAIALSATQLRILIQNRYIRLITGLLISLWAIHQIYHISFF